MIQDPSLTIGRRPAQVNQAIADLGEGRDRSPNGPQPDFHDESEARHAAHLIDSHGVQELKGISCGVQCVVNGALVRRRELQASEVIAVLLPKIDAGREMC